MRTFEVFLNGNMFFSAYTLEVENAKEAKKIAIIEAKANNNKSIDIIEVGGLNYVSGTIFIK